jgi:hypothetical protein
MCGGVPLKSEVIRIRGRQIDLQVFESTIGLKVGDDTEFSSELLSATLGPGMLGMIYDGLQNPLQELENDQGFFLRRGQYLPALDQKKLWDFEPMVKAGAQVRAGHYLGQVTEGLFPHPIMAPLRLLGAWEVKEIKAAGPYTVNETIAILKSLDSQAVQEVNVTLKQEWPVKRPMRIYEERLLPDTQLLTQCRLIDIFFPMAEGGTACIPGPFGAGKTVLQQIISRYAQTDIVIIVACGERAGEVVETIREFPELEDPKTGRSLMERTIIICNTSSMPVAAREASIYTGVTLGEYYRQLGLKVLLLADSTSRWAQALRESSARMEEIPGEEAFPAYLESRIAAVYERAGKVRLHNDESGSLTMIGTVSPAPVFETVTENGTGYEPDDDRGDGKSLAELDDQRQPLDFISELLSQKVGNQIEDEAITGVAQADPEEQDHKRGKEIGRIQMAVFGVAVKLQQRLNALDEPVVPDEHRGLLVVEGISRYKPQRQFARRHFLPEGRLLIPRDPSLQAKQVGLLMQSRHVARIGRLVERGNQLFLKHFGAFGDAGQVDRQRSHLLRKPADFLFDFVKAVFGPVEHLGLRDIRRITDGSRVEQNRLLFGNHYFNEKTLRRLKFRPLLRLHAVAADNDAGLFEYMNMGEIEISP